MKNRIKNEISKNYKWSIEITIITFILAIICSLISQIASSLNDLFIPIMILLIMIFISIIFDGIGVSVTSCDIDRLYYYKKQNLKNYNIAIMLVKNAEKVNNICADVIGDMCGILSGACGATIVVSESLGSHSPFITVALSSLIVSFTVGGKAFLKGVAVRNSEEFIYSTAKIIGIFIRGKNENTRKD